MSLASKCMEPAFRMHLRAHSTVAKFFQALKDAPSHAVRDVLKKQNYYTIDELIFKK